MFSIYAFMHSWTEYTYVHNTRDTQLGMKCGWHNGTIWNEMILKNGKRFLFK